MLLPLHQHVTQGPSREHPDKPSNGQSLGRQSHLLRHKQPGQDDLPEGGDHLVQGGGARDPQGTVETASAERQASSRPRASGVHTGERHQLGILGKLWTFGAIKLGGHSHRSVIHICAIERPQQSAAIRWTQVRSLAGLKPERGIPNPITGPDQPPGSNTSEKLRPRPSRDRRNRKRGVGSMGNKPIGIVQDEHTIRF